MKDHIHKNNCQSGNGETSYELQVEKRLTTSRVLQHTTDLPSLIFMYKIHFGIPRKKVSILSSLLFLILLSSVGASGHGDSTLAHDSCLLTSQSTISDSVALEEPSSSSSLYHHNNDVYSGHQDFHYEAHHPNNQTNDDGDEDDSDVTESGMSSGGKRRVKRSVVHLYDMVVCATGCNPLAYKGYGCYCGFLGSGLTVDGIDRCCAKHDWCYHHAKCPPLLTYFVPYYWTCNNGRPSCVSDYRGWKGICGANMCECDRQFAECLRKFPCPRSRAMCMTSPWRNLPIGPNLVFVGPKLG